MLNGGGQWHGSESQMIRAASKVVVIVLPARGDANARINAVLDAYRQRFQREAMLRITQPSCVSL